MKVALALGYTITRVEDVDSDDSDAMDITPPNEYVPSCVAGVEWWTDTTHRTALQDVHPQAHQHTRRGSVTGAACAGRTPGAECARGLGCRKASCEVEVHA